jgi:hypothetical protein
MRRPERCIEWKDAVMVCRPCTFKQGDLTRALKAAQAAGVQVKIEIERDGKMIVTTIGNSVTVDSDQNLKMTPEKLMKLL